MNANEIIRFRRYLREHDLENLENRRAFHENFEWLEGYWRNKPVLANIDGFCGKYGAFYSGIVDIETLAQQLASEGVVRNSRDRFYRPSSLSERRASRLVRW